MTPCLASGRLTELPGARASVSRRDDISTTSRTLISAVGIVLEAARYLDPIPLLHKLFREQSELITKG